MTPAARLAAAADILDTLDCARPVEIQLKTWARANRYAGSKDRRAIADRVYACLRRRRSFAARGGSLTGRAIVLGSLATEDGLSVDDIASLCVGGYGLAPLSDADRIKLTEPVVYATEGEKLDWPDWLMPEVERAFARQIDEELDALRWRAPLDLRVNTLKGSVSQVRAELAEEGIDAVSVPICSTALRLPAGVPIVRSRVYRSGLVELQDAASQAVADFATARPGESVLDICAGAGGKTLALAAAMENQGELIVHDVNPDRMAPLSERAARAGVSIINRAGLDGIAPLTCDCVLVDAPCSGSGSWRRDPAGKWRLDQARLNTLKEDQRNILSKAAQYVRPGGRLVYATCSILPLENEDQAAWFAAGHPEFSKERTLTLHTARDGADGFFAVCFRRRIG